MNYIRKYYVMMFVSLFLLTGCGVDYHFKNAERLKNDGKLEKAITKYKKIIEKYPTSEYAATSQFTIANIYLYKIKNYTQAKTEYQLFVKNYPSDRRIDEASSEIRKIDEIIGLLSKAQEDLQNQKIKDAIEGFENILKLDPDSPQGKQGLEQAKQEEIIEVKTGDIILCEKCGKTIKENTKIVKVRRKDSGHYDVKKIHQGLCYSCYEAEKYREKSPEEADEEWLKFRNNESKYRGTVTTWRMQCFSLDYYSGFLDSLHYYALCSMGNLPNPRTVKLDLTYEQSRKIREDDWLIVTGKFEYITQNGFVGMKAIKIKNLGAQ